MHIYSEMIRSGIWWKQLLIKLKIQITVRRNKKWKKKQWLYHSVPTIAGTWSKFLLHSHVILAVFRRKKYSHGKIYIIYEDVARSNYQVCCNKKSHGAVQWMWLKVDVHSALCWRQPLFIILDHSMTWPLRLTTPYIVSRGFFVCGFFSGIETQLDAQKYSYSCLLKRMLMTQKAF